MPRKKKPTPKLTEKYEHHGCKVVVEQYDVEKALKIDAKTVAFHRDSDTGAFVSPEAPYLSFGTLDELGKAIVDCRREQAE